MKAVLLQCFFRNACSITFSLLVTKKSLSDISNFFPDKDVVEDSKGDEELDNNIQRHECRMLLNLD